MTTIHLASSEAKPSETLVKTTWFYGRDELDKWLVHHLMPDEAVTNENLLKLKALAAEHGWEVKIEGEARE